MEVFYRFDTRLARGMGLEWVGLAQRRKAAKDRYATLSRFFLCAFAALREIFFIPPRAAG